ANWLLLIQDHQGHSRIPAAMLHLAGTHETHDSMGRYSSDPETALEWYRKAASLAEPGTRDWFAATIGIAQRIRFGPAGHNGLAEARALLESALELAKY